MRNRFRALDKDKVERLWNEGLLDLIYSVIVSTGQIFNLIRLRNERNRSISPGAIMRIDFGILNYERQREGRRYVRVQSGRACQLGSCWGVPYRSNRGG